MRPKNDNPEIVGSADVLRSRSLAELLDGLTYSSLSAVPASQVQVSDVTCDSRHAGPSSLFVALAGTKTDGHQYCGQAIAQGCAAILIEEGKADPVLLSSPSVCLIGVQDSRRAYAWIAANFFDHPAGDMKFIGITGTNGKTTITYLLEHILNQAGLPVGVIGTVNYRYTTATGKIEAAAPFTTPEPLILQGLLRAMADAGVRYVLMEASSHALSQHRLGDIRFDVAAFTNLSRDHLDYHADMETYFAVKTRLFTDYLKNDGKAVITCCGGQWQQRLVELCANRGIETVRVGAGQEAEVRIVTADSRRDGTELVLATATGNLNIASPLVGGFNVENILTTLGLCRAMGLNLREAGRSLATTHGAPGRLQPVSAGPDDDSRPDVFIDYAHTPDALRQVLTTLTALPHGNLICVFGCGGDRDRGKRPVMGAIAAAMSDVVIVTDDNPRTESSDQIIAQILPGLQESGLGQRDIAWLGLRQSDARGYLVLPCREEAIAVAIKTAGPDDIILIAGKGHEKYQIGPGGKRFFDDSLEAQEALIAWNCTSMAQALAGTFAGHEPVSSFNAVSTDSRSLAAGDIFVALKGENFDAHDFLAQVIAARAGCLVISKADTLENTAEIPRFLVQDTQVALGNLAGFRRRLLRQISRPLVIGITGSCGKTTVKEMTAAILQRQWPDGPETPTERVIKTQGNFNNLIGLPLSLLPLGVKHRAAILEMGMNHPGEIAQLVRIADPDICCIVGIHAAHLEGLQSVAGVAAAKEELFAGAGEGAILAINLDDAYVRAMADRYSQKKITYSATGKGRAQQGPDLWASDVTTSRAATVSYVLHGRGEEIPVSLQAPGAHNVGNSLAAAAIALAAGCSLQTIAAGLEDFRPGDKRMVILESGAGYSLINDTYNANPGSMAAGLATLNQVAAGTTMAILGDMLELGEASRSLHQQIGRVAAEQGISFLALFGLFADAVRDGAVEAGMSPEKIRVFTAKDAIAAWVQELGEEGALKKGDWILIKASRGLRFETIVQQLAVSS
ncbi:MAG: UDP-N-acetylmuramoyl-L-alanyl-D-glutamate--2,6-diaminopimelate ligase [Desulfocapsaceae bacterium]|nr:UDP-N-acetylmuramoyl-L-alanyl-D-glutamate--2,6-diaminopimelate ligase [Desulfocapsaceae bacterium]